MSSSNPLGDIQVGASYSRALNVRVDNQCSNGTERKLCRLLGQTPQDLIEFQSHLELKEACTHPRALHAEMDAEHNQVHGDTRLYLSPSLPPPLPLPKAPLPLPKAQPGKATNISPHLRTTNAETVQDATL